MINFQKAAMIGTGFVGSSSAFTLMQSGLFSEMILIDGNGQRAKQWILPTACRLRTP